MVAFHEFIFGVHLTWKPVKDYIRGNTKPNDREKCYFDSYDPAELEQVTNTRESYRLSERTETYRFIPNTHCDR